MQSLNPRLLDQVRAAIRARHYSPRTEESYIHWIRRFILFHDKRHPQEMGEPEITRYISCLATHGKVSPSTQNQALSAILFLYREVLRQNLEWMSEIVRARKPQRLPAVLSRDEVRSVLSRMEGVPRLMATLMYGTGMRLLECCKVRVQDIDFSSLQITVRSGKGGKDRTTLLPQGLIPELRRHLEQVHSQHESDLKRQDGWVELPLALERKYPNAGREWPWQWVFPATRPYVHQQTGRRRRHHLHESVVQKAFRSAVREASLSKRATCHTLRHYEEFRIMRSDSRKLLMSHQLGTCISA